MRLIDADALDDVVTRLNAENWGITVSDYKMIDRVLFEFPTVDTPTNTPNTPTNAMRRGKWIHLDSMDERHDELRCPFCHKDFTVDAYRMCDIGFTAEDLKHCPNCGARMEEEDANRSD